MLQVEGLGYFDAGTIRMVSHQSFLNRQPIVFADDAPSVSRRAEL